MLNEEDSNLIYSYQTWWTFLNKATIHLLNVKYLMGPYLTINNIVDLIHITLNGHHSTYPKSISNGPVPWKDPNILVFHKGVPENPYGKLYEP